MLHRREQVFRRRADPLRRRVRRDQLGELVLERDQLVDELVVVEVADLWIVEDVVAVAVMVDLLAKLLDPPFRLRELPLLGHARSLLSGCDD